MLYGDESDDLYMPHGLVPENVEAASPSTLKGSTNKRKSRLKCKLVVCAISVVLSVLLAIVGPKVLKEIEHTQIQSNTVISSTDSLGYAGWADSSVQSLRYHRVYVFEITNPSEILKGDKVRVKERGPFVYAVVKQKINVAWDKYGEDEVTYQDWTHYKFDREKTMAETNGKHKSDNETFTVVNAFFWGMEAQAGKEIWKLYFKDYTPKNRMFAKLSVRDLGK